MNDWRAIHVRRLQLAGPLHVFERQQRGQAGRSHAFEDKPPYTEWLRAIPSFVVTHPQPGLLGLAALAGDAA